jgi:DNA-binding MarR family transcriptional regulator
MTLSGVQNSARDERGSARSAHGLEDVEWTAWQGLQRMHALLARSVNHHLTTESVLSLHDYNLLSALRQQPNGRMRSGDLGHALGWERSRVSHHVARMSQRKLVTGHRPSTDRRGLLITMTPLGRTTLDAATPAHIDNLRRSFTALLSPLQLRTLIDVATLVDTAAVEFVRAGPTRGHG